MTSKEQEETRTNQKGNINKSFKNSSAQDKSNIKVLKPKDEEEECKEGGMDKDQGQYYAKRSHHQPDKSQGGGEDEKVPQQHLACEPDAGGEKDPAPPLKVRKRLLSNTWLECQMMVWEPK